MTAGVPLEQNRAELALRSLHHACKSKGRPLQILRWIDGKLWISVNGGGWDYKPLHRPWATHLAVIEREVWSS